MSDTQINVSVDGAHANITFSTDSGINVMSSHVMKNFHEAIEQVARNKDVRTTAICSTGKVFIAGADIKEMQNYTRSQAIEYGQLGKKVTDALAAMPSITVAAINGAALGGGLEIAIACDFRIAVKSAKIGLPESSLGLVPGWGGVTRIRELVTLPQAKRLYLSALPISGEDAMRIGLVDEIVNGADDLPARVEAFCKSFRRGGPEAIALCKRASRDGKDIEAFADCFETDQVKEGIGAFLGKRPAAWME